MFIDPTELEESREASFATKYPELYNEVYKHGRGEPAPFGETFYPFLSWAKSIIKRIFLFWKIFF